MFAFNLRLTVLLVSLLSVFVISAETAEATIKNGNPTPANWPPSWYPKFITVYLTNGIGYYPPGSWNPNINCKARLVALVINSETAQIQKLGSAAVGSTVVLKIDPWKFNNLKIVLGTRGNLFDYVIPIDLLVAVGQFYRAEAFQIAILALISPDCYQYPQFYPSFDVLKEGDTPVKPTSLGRK